jgi:ribonuclease E
LRDLGGLIVIDFIDMMDKKHEAEVEKAFKRAISMDRARIQLSRISKFGLLELSRQKKQSTIQEISYTTCPFCQGRGARPSLEYTALSAYRRIESQAVRGISSAIRVKLPYEISEYLLNQKRLEIGKLEMRYDLVIHISGDPGMTWDMMEMDLVDRKANIEIAEEVQKPSTGDEKDADASVEPIENMKKEEAESIQRTIGSPEKKVSVEPTEKKTRRRPHHRRRKPGLMQQMQGKPDESLSVSEVDGGVFEEAILPVAALSDDQEIDVFIDEDAPVTGNRESGESDDEWFVHPIIGFDDEKDNLPE